MKLPLTSGAYQAASIIASSQRSVNLYGEQNPEGSEFPFTFYPTPGLILRGTAPQSGYRGAYVASSGDLFVCVGFGIYQVLSDFTFKMLGTIGTSGTPVSMRDNSVTLVIVDGSTSGYTVDLVTHAWSAIGVGATDNDGDTTGGATSSAFYGSDRVDFVDTFLVFNKPASAVFYLSDSVAVTFDPLYFAAKSGNPDALVAAVVLDRYIWLFGQMTTEVFYNSGAADFPFEREPGVFIQHGSAAKYSFAQTDNSIYWVAQNPQGRGIIMRTDGMSALRISTHALEQEIQGYARIDDAIGYTHQMNGHLFYVVTFPTADKTWAFDLATGQWNERLWMDTDGSLHRHRGACYAFWNGKALMGDWENGNLYEMTPDAVDDAGAPMIHIRSFPDMCNDGARLFFREFIADMQVGAGLEASDVDPQVRLRWSDDRGASWGNPIMSSLGKTGETLTSIQFQRLGMARHRVFELSWSAPVRTALNGAYVQVRSGSQ
ncbi:packaged DNA stabilization protein [Paraburkholderia metrosideri]|uniref:Packaged DNA stabilization protein n=1 Tax=Paraburkholderia metrosideri TaxID=580937 RepID=A0ABW9DST7_9BURK